MYLLKSQTTQKPGFGFVAMTSYLHQPAPVRFGWLGPMLDANYVIAPSTQVYIGFPGTVIQTREDLSTSTYIYDEHPLSSPH